MNVNRDSPIPVAHQLEALIRDQIERGEVRPGDRLPTEFEFCRRLGLSRTPVRRALGRLTAEGLLVRTPGRGTYVSLAAARDRRQSAAVVSVTVIDDRWCWPLQRAAAQWNAEHPEQPVRLRFHVVELPRLRSRLALAVAQGAATDISVVDSVWVAEFAERGYLRSLDAIDPARAADLAAALLPPLRAANTFAGELYAMPAEADLAVLWYRKDWFAAEGLNPPRTWDQWTSCARHFQRPAVRDRYGLGPYSLAFVAGRAAGETTTYQLLPVLWAAGVDVIADDQVVLNTPVARDAVEFVSGLVHTERVAGPDVIEAPWTGPALAFAAGSVALALGGSYESALIQAAAGWDNAAFHDRVGLVPVPAGPDGHPATVVGGISYGIFRQSRQPALALELVARATTPELLRQFCAQTGQNPPTVAATRALDPTTEPFLHAAAQLLPYARGRWPLVEYPRVSAQIVRMFESAIAGELSPAEAVARAAAVIAGITGLPEREMARPRRQPVGRLLASGGR